ncbi:lipopolysaccharide biosynthesis protein [Stappia sp. P2PMeth1]|uniref:lipopolysaccharide biosynthesis protein n=1 Tax=Stappia sp. P2PMeth1 TaxID=2003586 RepID=UPI00164624C8|nr:oligosaccharide flippase family protein [Stappia sp. P2PMeth1]
MIGRIRAIIASKGGRKIFWALVSRGSSTVLSFALLLVASRVLDTDEYGLYIFLFSIGSSLGLIAVFGQQVLLMKHFRVAEHVRGETNQPILFYNALWLGVGCGGQVLAALVVWIFSDRLPYPYDHLPVALLFGAIFTLSEYLQSYFIVHARIVLALVPRENLWRLVSSLTLVGLAWAGLLHTGAAAIEIVTGLLALMVGYQFVRFVGREGLSFLGSAEARAQVPSRAWRRETLTFSANGFFSAAAVYFETILIGIAIGLDVAAFYFVATRIASLLILPVLAIDTVGVPLISARFQERDYAGAQKLVSMLSAGSFVLAFIGGLALLVVGPFVLHLFNPAFVEHFPVLVLLSIGAIAHAFFGPGTWLMMIGGGEAYLLKARSLVFAAYLGLLFLLASQFGPEGVAMAGVIELVTLHLISRRWVLRKWQVDNAATSFLVLRWRERRAAGEAARQLEAGDNGRL